ncbi:hypothetical protein KDA_69420 [Dictyobacter alpinus]|uniref:DUF4288 domain-containing protein n=1 Tax=Dictyobacter alpinus TaxID=2014873 RepID=A0A402BJD5_9CHLR|nr:DUF4288 domain-containing protein [Dictyobacter alpinus]GCE31458.1 hypothetical protein KDA_69420 [Dictyobacter alpinus]
MNIEQGSTDQSYYIAIVLYEAASDAPNYTPLYQESFLLLQASSQAEANEKALLHAKSATTSYQNEYGETITWTLKTIVDVNTALTNTLEDGAELYARHFHNYQAYEAFEPLLSKEEL